MVQCSASPAKPQQSLSVAVIGAGAAGLVAARELVREGHHVTVFEKGSSTGGVWVYTDEVEAPDLLGQDPDRHKVHSSMYAQLRTNLPREVMAYTDFAFDDLAGQSKDSRRFPSHEEVLRYLQAFAAAFQLHKYVQFDTEVTAAVPIFSHSHQQQPQQQSDVPRAAADANGNADVAANGHPHHQSPLPWPKWQITTQRVHHKCQLNSTEQTLKLEQASSRQASASKPPKDPSQQTDNMLRSNGTQSHAQTDDLQSPEGGSQPDSNTQTDSQSQTAMYDALVVCNGHYSAPRCPQVTGSDLFPGQVMHSHNYRHNEAFKGQIVVLVGASASGEDICREIAEVADKVYLCARSWQNPAWATETIPFGHQHNIWRRPVPTHLAKDGSVTFSDGQQVEEVDTVIYCTGYLYTFPFLEDIVSTADNRYCCCCTGLRAWSVVVPVYAAHSVLHTSVRLSLCTCVCLSVVVCKLGKHLFTSGGQHPEPLVVVEPFSGTYHHYFPFHDHYRLIITHHHYTPSLHPIITHHHYTPSLHPIITHHHCTPSLHTIITHHHYTPSLHIIITHHHYTPSSHTIITHREQGLALASTVVDLLYAV
ncbi:TPA: hypothetical protein ACH3X1_010945 [Trebouxia sp. C0004]